MDRRSAGFFRSPAGRTTIFGILNPGQVSNIGHQLWKVRLIELVAAPIQGSRDGVRKGLAEPLEMLERHLRVVAAVI